MSLSSRLAMIFKSKASKALDRAEDPRETLDYSYERQLEMLQQVRRGVVDVATSRKRLELQLQQLQASADRMQQQAAQAGSVTVDASTIHWARATLARDGTSWKLTSVKWMFGDDKPHEPW